MSEFIGQEKIISEVGSYVINGTVPRFFILTGARASGKTYLSKIISSMTSEFTVNIERTIDSIRQMIDVAYKVTAETMYVIDNCDGMSIAAMNCLLKISEEPPRKARILLIFNNIEIIPKTLISRACVLKLQPYKNEEIKSYYENLKLGLSNEEKNLLLKFSSSPAELNNLINTDLDTLLTLILEIRDVGDKSGVDSFKLSSFIKVKKDSEGFDLKFVMLKFIQFLSSNPDENGDSMYEKIKCTRKYISKLEKSSTNILSIFDRWILDLRSI